MRHDLARLGSAEFEDLSQALALRILGPGVSVFGAGRDGGREATFEGQMRYPEPSPDGPWDGYGILQAKYKATLYGTGQDTAWLQGQIKKELDAWANSEANRVKRVRQPEFLLFTTNVTLSAVPGSGGIDTINKFIGEYAETIGLPLKGWSVWHHDQICRLLDGHTDVRRTYAAFLTPGDILTQLQEILAGAPANLGDILAMHATQQIVNGQWIRLSEAGDTTSSKLRLGSVGIDLPATLDFSMALNGYAERRTEVSGVVGHIVELADHCRRPSLKRLDNRHIVLIGGPGQGKTTITDLLTQLYRVALLEDREAHRLGPAASIREQLSDGFDEIRLPRPRCRRWPFKVVLSQYGDAISGGEDISLLSYIASYINRRTPITEEQLRSWLRLWPWLLVLDGLDEVTVPSVREKMMNNVTDFLIEAAACDADLLVVGTTRPQGYGEEFTSGQFKHLTLRHLNTTEAMNYATRLANVRHEQDDETRDTVLDRVREAMGEPLTQRLMRTPLQVTIMSLLLERRRRAPQDRHALFEAYYNVLYDREVNKGTSISRLLDEQRTNVDYLHEHIGLHLQIRAEHAGEADPSLPLDELKAMAIYRLTAHEFDRDKADLLADQLVKAATDRLVQLVPRAPGNVGFEIRSLQELMAARALTSGADATVIKRLGELAPSAHWRNTWLFAASRVFARSEHLHDSIITLLEKLDTETPFQMLALPGARLAVEMIDEDIAANVPVYRRLLAKRVLELLRFSPSRDIAQISRVLFHVAESHIPAQAMIDRALDDAIAGSGIPAISANLVLKLWTSATGPITASARRRLPVSQWGSSDVDYSTPGVNPGNTASIIGDHLENDLSIEDAHCRKLKSVINVLESGRLDTATELLTAEVMEDLAMVVQSLPAENWQQAAHLRALLIHWYERRPIASGELSALAATSLPSV
ncbi:hypothetical protein GCM10023196_004540 [Actinoallomurus vinaceus]|uniref:NACHT domain-containing protein n=1 Tax=Actinoallomurus vinaceus TaxID=1080074 RepID=A0ABP8U2D2_9ACTN